MPELAEVEHSRRTWDAGTGQRVRRVETRYDEARVFRGTDLARLREALRGVTYLASEARGKQLCFRFGKRGEIWVGIHLGMRGRLHAEAPSYAGEKHDLLILRQAKRSLVFTDLRHFGRVLFHEGDSAPPWWSGLAPSVLSAAFTKREVQAYFQRRQRTVVKAVLLSQARFPGIGNWMADEILWRARIHPRTPAGDLDDAEVGALYRAIRHVSKEAVKAVDDEWSYPSSWLFAHRWKDGGKCPRCRHTLRRSVVGGRKTCWCEACQGS